MDWSSYCIQPANQSSELCIYVWAYCVHPFILSSLLSTLSCNVLLSIQVCVLSLRPEPTVVCCNGVCNARILSIASVPSSAGELLLPPPPPAASDTAAGNDSWPRRRPAGRPRPPVRSTDWPAPVVLPAWGSAPATPALGWSTPPTHHHSDWGGGGGGSRGSGNKSWLVNSDDGRPHFTVASVIISVSVFEARKYSTWDVRDFWLNFFMRYHYTLLYVRTE